MTAGGSATATALVWRWVDIRLGSMEGPDAPTTREGRTLIGPTDYAWGYEPLSTWSGEDRKRRHRREVAGQGRPALAAVVAQHDLVRGPGDDASAVRGEQAGVDDGGKPIG